MSFSVINAATIGTFRVRNLADLAPLAHNVALFDIEQAEILYGAETPLAYESRIKQHVV